MLFLVFNILNYYLLGMIEPNNIGIDLLKPCYIIITLFFTLFFFSSLLY